MHGVQRPLSPYWIYRWEITMWLSSLHRITGLLLSLGAVALAVWLIALASGADSFNAVSRVDRGRVVARSFFGITGSSSPSVPFFILRRGILWLPIRAGPALPL